MARSEKPLRSCPLTLAMILRSSSVLRHVPTMEQCMDVENSQSFLRCPRGLSNAPDGWRLDSRNLPDVDGASITLIFWGVIMVCGGTIVILRPWVILEKPDCDVYQSLQSPL